VAETNAAITASGTLGVSDVDDPSTVLPQSNVAGVYGTFSIAANGQWSYTANSAYDSLNVGQSVSDSFTVSAADGTTTTVQVTIAANGAWTYTANGAYDNLNVGQSVSDTFTVAAPDGTTSTVQVTITGTDDAAVISSANFMLTAGDTPASTGGVLGISDPDN